MLNVLLVSVRTEDLSLFVKTLNDDPGVRLEVLPTGEAALDRIRRNPPDLAVIDQELPDMFALDLTARIVASNPMVNTAVVSPLSEAAFHEASEGLGVLAKLQPMPTAQDGRELLVRLRQVTAPFPAPGAQGE
ncbi:MAG: hypothetical protein ACOCVU_02755 [Desulfohalobiaceae bacterium]